MSLLGPDSGCQAMISCTCRAVASSSTSFNLHLLLRRSSYAPPLRISYRPKCCFASYNSGNDNAASARLRSQRRRKGEAELEAEEVSVVEQRKVQCEVEVISWRERKIKGEILVNSDVQSVWNALTDYERLADFIPNLVCSGRIPCPHPGRIWLEQRGQQQALYWHIEARVVLDLQEFIKSAYERDLHFSMVDGDFKKFEGKWSLRMGTRSSTTRLSYEVSVIPRFNFPAIFLERIIRSDLPINLQALAFRAERNSEGTHKLKMMVNPPLDKKPTTVAADIQGSLLNERKVSPNDVISCSVVANPLPAPTVEVNNSNWGLFGKVCRLDKPCMVDEVHLRRLDGLLENGGVHRCVVASITVKAPVCEVWSVLTAYETLPEIVPNLAISKILSRENNRVRILQEGCKGLLYMMLHARVVLDLCEQLEKEISFEQVEGDFDSFQGKWILEQLGGHHTLLKYTVESKMHKDSFLSEAIMEEVIYEDLPSNLSAIRDYIEKRGSSDSDTSEVDQYDEDGGEISSSAITGVTSWSCGSDSQSLVSHRPRVPGLQRDMDVLKAELLKFISEHGQEGFMPMRKQLRLHGRVDIEKAITRMGGFRRIASMLNLSLAYKHRKPKGYWDDLENLEEEIHRFQRSWGMDPSYMPSRKSFERAGRYDIARALEKWGGLLEVSRLLSLKVRRPKKQSGVARKTESGAANEGEEENKSASRQYISQDTQKWLSQLKHLDINWVE